MGKRIAIVGESGTGKSTSIGGNESLGIKGLNPEETFIINIEGKDLPFPGAYSDYSTDLSIKEATTQGNYVETDNPDHIVKIMKHISQNRPEIKNIVVDDAGYLQSNEFMRRAMEKGYDKFGFIALAGYKPVDEAKRLRNDITTFFIYHEENKDDFGNEKKIKTSGKMVDNHVKMEGLFTIMLYAVIDKDGNRLFATQSYQGMPSKSPHGMFKDLLIPNDLGYVVDKIREYYNI